MRACVSHTYILIDGIELYRHGTVKIPFCLVAMETHLLPHFDYNSYWINGGI